MNDLCAIAKQYRANAEMLKLRVKALRRELKDIRGLPNEEQRRLQAKINRYEAIIGDNLSTAHYLEHYYDKEDGNV